MNLSRTNWLLKIEEFILSRFKPTRQLSGCNAYEIADEILFTVSCFERSLSNSLSCWTTTQQAPDASYPAKVCANKTGYFGVFDDFTTVDQSRGCSIFSPENVILPLGCELQLKIIQSRR